MIQLYHFVSYFLLKTFFQKGFCSSFKKIKSFVQMRIFVTVPMNLQFYSLTLRFDLKILLFEQIYVVLEYGVSALHCFDIISGRLEYLSPRSLQSLRKTKILENESSKNIKRLVEKIRIHTTFEGLRI